MIKLFYIGEHFAMQSGMYMSVVYEIGTNARWSWGQVLAALGNGFDVQIRPATASELAWAQQKLTEYLAAKANA